MKVEPPDQDGGSWIKLDGDMSCDRREPGIGLEYCRQLQERGDQVVACAARAVLNWRRLMQVVAELI